MEGAEDTVSDGRRTFVAIFAGTVVGVLAGIVGGAVFALAAEPLGPDMPGFAASFGAMVMTFFVGPATAAYVLGADMTRHLSAGYVTAIVVTVVLSALAYAYVPLVPVIPTIIAVASTAGMRLAHRRAHRHGPG